MHPILGRPARLAAYLGAWLIIAGVIAVVLSRQGLTFTEAAVFVIPLFLVYAFICLSAYYVCQAVPISGSSPTRVLAVVVFAAAVAGGLWTGLARATILAIDQLPAYAGSGRFERQMPVLFFAAELLFVLALAVNYLLIAFEETREAQQRQIELTMHARDAELRALRAQLDPHFLYNCLNSIAALTTADAAGARRMCLLLGEFLRSTLRVGALERIPLGDELALAEGFLSIEQVRFGSRLQVSRHVDTEALPARVPPLFLQPLVENAIRHGIANLLEGGVIEMQVARVGDRLSIAVENPCDPETPAPKGLGHGMNNVRQRLLAMFGDQATMSARLDEGRFRVELTLPFVAAEQV